MAEPVLEINGVHFQSVYFLKGVVPKQLRAYWSHYSIGDPPVAGNSHAFIVDGGDGKRDTLLCPYTLSAYTIDKDAGEVCHDDPMELTEDRLYRLVCLIQRKWREYVRMGFQRDYGVAALVLKRLGAAIPEESLRDVESTEDERVKGKPVGDRLIKPVTKKSRRGQIATFFLENSNVFEAMATFGMTRSAVLTHLHGLHEQHGLGYTLRGDSAELLLPPKCKTPFGRVGVVLGKPVALENASPLPGRGKRREVAYAFMDGWKGFQEVADGIGCSLASVRSHLYDLHVKHGYGYEMSDDKKRARLLSDGLDLLL